MRKSAIAFCLVSLFLFTSCATVSLMGRDVRAPETIYLATADGWMLALHRYRPESRLPGAAPVLLIPDVYENATAFHLDSNHSLVETLVEAGFDVSILELRGQGASEKPAWWNDRRYDWTFDDYVRRDIPATVVKLRELTGADKVTLGGHGLGGMACFAYAQDHVESVSGLFGLGVGGRFVQRNGLHEALLIKQDALDLLDRVPAPQGATAPAPHIGAQKSLFDELLCNDMGIDEQVRLGYYRLSLEPVSLGVVRQIADWLMKGTFASYDRRIDYYDGLSRIQCPVLLVSGKSDNLIPIGSSVDLFEKLGSTEKTHRIGERGEAFSIDYSHAGLLIGERASDEIGGELARWLRARIGR